MKNLDKTLSAFVDVTNHGVGSRDHYGSNLLWNKDGNIDGGTTGTVQLLYRAWTFTNREQMFPLMQYLIVY